MVYDVKGCEDEEKQMIKKPLKRKNKIDKENDSKTTLETEFCTIPANEDV